MNRKTFAALALALAVPALGAPVLVSAQASSAPSTVQAGTYQVESHHTLAEFTVSHFGFNDFFGVIPGATGSMTLNPANLAVTQLDVSLPVSASRPPMPRSMAS
jgi:polyisoprenoid-binding protein YceI